MKRFNTAGTCRPNEHYMVDITERLEIIRKMIAKGDYFCINRGRQYGKSTTLKAISSSFTNEYCVFSLSFEGLADSSYADEEKFYAAFVYQMADAFEWTPLEGLDPEVGEYISTFSESHDEKCSEKALSKFISNVCHRNTKPVVVLIDEVDQAGNYPSFLKLLALLRRMYLDRDVKPTFQSVILAGVYDVKNLKLKMRPEDEHQYNSPWNIAVPFDVDMSLPADGIAGMLAEYKADHHLEFDNVAVGQMIYDYTSGYPFLVSRLCQIIDSEGWTWDKEGVLRAVNAILKEENTLFDDFVKKLNQFPDLRELMKNILYLGTKKAYSPDEHNLQLARRFNFVTVENGLVKIACRLMETRLYNLFLAEDDFEKMFRTGMSERNQFIHDGVIDMKHLMERFCVHFNEIFRTDEGSMDYEFLEKQGRKQFMLYLKPFINGVGNFYVEPETRDETRSDLIIDYLGQQYVIELKIWRGNAYNERGEDQLCRYLEYFDLQTGYLLSFCFNKTKQPGLLPAVELKGRTLIEAIV